MDFKFLSRISLFIVIMFSLKLKVIYFEADIVDIIMNLYTFLPMAWDVNCCILKQMDAVNLRSCVIDLDFLPRISVLNDRLWFRFEIVVFEGGIISPWNFVQMACDIKCSILIWNRCCDSLVLGYHLWFSFVTCLYNFSVKMQFLVLIWEWT